jgi:hypothetical protein
MKQTTSEKRFNRLSGLFVAHHPNYERAPFIMKGKDGLGIENAAPK